MLKNPKDALIIAIISLIVIFGAAMFLRTETGRRITGLNITGMFSDAGQKKLKKSAKRVQDRYIVVLKNDTQDLDATIQDLASISGAEVKDKYDKVLKGFAAKLPEAQVQKLLDDDRVEFVEEDGLVEPAATQTGATLGLDRIDQRDLPINGTYNYDATGQGVNVYIIDSGIRVTHTEFGGRARIGADYIGDGQNGNDCHGHGTHVAGTVGSNTYGVAKRSNLIALRVLACNGSGTVSGIISATNWIASDKGSNSAVANLSLILSGPSDSLDRAVNQSIRSGVTYAIAAGNFGMDACAYSPPRILDAITVGSVTPNTDNTDYKMGYSNIGTCLDIFAPGNGITSLSHVDDTSIRGMSGTSMASPHVAGVAALYLETHRTASASEVRNAIVNSATTGTIVPLDANSPNKVLYSFLSEGVPNDPPPPTGTNCAGTSYAGSVTSGGVAYHTSGGFAGRAGTYSGVLTSTNGGQASLVLERKQGKNWLFQATSSGDVVTQSISYPGTKGTYRWKVNGVTDTTYTLCSKLP